MLLRDLLTASKSASSWDYMDKVSATDFLNEPAKGITPDSLNKV